jgi:hypothetical protein
MSADPNNRALLGKAKQPIKGNLFPPFRPRGDGAPNETFCFWKGEVHGVFLRGFKHRRALPIPSTAYSSTDSMSLAHTPADSLSHSNATGKAKEGQTIWTPIGAVWPHKRSKNFHTTCWAHGIPLIDLSHLRFFHRVLGRHILAWDGVIRAQVIRLPEGDHVLLTTMRVCCDEVR